MRNSHLASKKTFESCNNLVQKDVIHVDYRNHEDPRTCQIPSDRNLSTKPKVGPSGPGQPICQREWCCTCATQHLVFYQKWKISDNSEIPLHQLGQ